MAVYSPENFEPCRSVGYLTKRIYQDVVALVDPIFAEAELSHAQWSALISIHFGSGSTCAALSHEISHDMGATSRMISGLEERGLIARTRSEGDRRVVHLSLTPAGLELASAFRDRLIEKWNDWLSDWAPEDVETLIGYLQRLRRTMQDVRAESGK